MGLAAHADVFVDRHVTDPSKGPSSRPGRTDARRRLGCRCPVSARNWSAHVQHRHRHRRRPRRLGDRRATPRARDRPCARTASCGFSACPTARSARSPGRSSPGRGSPTSRAAPRSPRSTRTSAVLGSSAADARPVARPRAARRSLGRGDRRGRRGRSRARPGSPRRSACARSRSPTATGRSTTRARDRLELPRHAVPRRGRALRGGRGAARGARAADGAHDRERVRADRADRTRRLGDGRPPPRGAARLRLRAGLRRARGGDRAHEGRPHDRRARPAAARGRRPRADDGRAACGAHARSSGRRGPSATCWSPPSFVNPAQFSASADLDGVPARPGRRRGPRRRGGDRRPLRPEREEMYPPGFATWVEPAGAADGLESEHRPQHFRGVATVCLKLLNIVRPQIAWFGRKDAQQVAVVKQLVRDLNLDVEIRVVDTVRDDDGLALSSRNAAALAAGARAGARHPPRARDPRPGPRARHPRRRRPRARLRRGRRPRRPDPRGRAAGRLGPPDRQHPTPGRRTLVTTRPRKPAPGTPAPGKLALPELAEMKRRGDRIVMITAYDAPSGRIADAAGVDLILVGDSAAMVMLGHDSTVPATMDEMIVLTRAVNRGRPAAARGRRPAVRLVPGLGRAGARERDPLRQGSERRRRQAGGSRAVARPRPRDHRRRRPRDGPHRPDAADGDDARRLQGAGTDGRARRCSSTRTRSRSRRRGASRSCSRPCRRRSPRRSRDALEIPTIGIGAGAGVRRPGARLARPARAVRRPRAAVRQAVRGARAGHPGSGRGLRATRCADGSFPAEQHTYSIPDEELALFEEALAEVRAGG